MINEKTPSWFLDNIISPVSGGDEAIISAFRSVPRAMFIDEGMRRKAYEDIALPIGMGQTISQPSTVAHMFKLLELSPKDRVLEIGSGSGFVTALLSKIVAHVYAIELLPVLMEKARTVIRGMGIRNVSFRRGDGGKGWDEFAPFNKIIASAGASFLPKSLPDQLVEGGIIVIPVNGVLMKYIKSNGQLESQAGIKVSFVDFVGS